MGVRWGRRYILITTVYHSISSQMHIFVLYVEGHLYSHKCCICNSVNLCTLARRCALYIYVLKTKQKKTLLIDLLVTKSFGASLSLSTATIDESLFSGHVFHSKVLMYIGCEDRQEIGSN